MIKDLIANKHYLTDKFTSHQYLNTYESVLAVKKQNAQNVLEIGVSKGGSILLWRDYFDKAQIYGLDIDDMPESIANDSRERITLIKGNAYDVNFMQEHFVSKGLQFDVMIDDGPHTLESMLFFAKHYSSLLAPGGILVVEDIPVLDWTNQIRNQLPSHLQSRAIAVDLRPINNRWDDILLLLQS